MKELIVFIFLSTALVASLSSEQKRGKIDHREKKLIAEEELAAGAFSIVQSPSQSDKRVFNKTMEFVHLMPKVEMHVHLEGTFSPERVIQIAARNGITLPDQYSTLDELKKAYEFKDLFSFLELYTICASTLQTERDFEELTFDYLTAAQAQGVSHAEIFVGFQIHMNRGIEFSTVFNGVRAAMKEAELKLGITSSLILDVDRGQSQEDAIELLNKALNCEKGIIIGVGLAYAENNENPPVKFMDLYQRAREAGLRTTAHAGEAFGPEYVKQAIQKLNVDRIDHGVRSLEDEETIQLLVEKQIPLTICPQSNVCLKVCKDIKHHPLKILMERGVMVTVNSDDPAYFGGGIEQNYAAVIEALDLSLEDVYCLGKNSISASFLDSARKESMLKELEAVYTKLN